MRFLIISCLVLFTVFSGCGGQEVPEVDTSTEINDSGASEAVPMVTVYPGWDIYSDIRWVNCSLSSNDDWGDQYQPVALGDTISFQATPGEYYDFRCCDSQQRVFYKWNVLIGEQGYVWEVTDRDPDNNFRYYSHLSDWTKQVGIVTLQNNFGWGVISSLTTTQRLDWEDVPVEVEYLHNEFVQPNSEFSFRVRAGMSYTIACMNTSGEYMLLVYNATIDESGMVIELRGD